ncbi:MAG: kelch repeat-containing protein [Planctomycetota bacterium]
MIFGGGDTLAYDAARDRVVSLGRVVHPHVEWNGNTWIDAGGALVPPGPGTMAFDRVGQRLLFYGGRTSLDTWAFDGRQWSNLTPITSPPGPLAGTLLWHGARAKVVWVGVTTQGVELWEWTGTTWQPAATAPAGVPFPFTAAYDAARQSVLFLSWASQRQYVTTVEWGSTLTAYGDRTPARAQPLLAFEPGRGRVVWVDPDSSLMREWNGAQWVNQTWAPDGLRAFAEAGAHGVAALGAAGALYYLQGSQWSSVSDVPSSREGHALAYDGPGSSVLLFGGLVGSADTNDTWSFDGTRWQRRQPAHAPTPRRGHAMTATSLGIVVSGGWYGTGSGSRVGDSWLWTGADWERVQGAPALFSPAAAEWRGVASAIMFGGTDGAGVTDGTYELRNLGTSTAWVAVSPINRPPARSGHGMAYDARRNRVVMFGGTDLASTFGDTWEWDGTNWQRMNPPSSPSSRSEHAMYFDSVRGRVVVRGGYGIVPPDAWEWSGSTWTPLAPLPSPAPIETPIAFDERWGRAVYVPRVAVMPPPSPSATQVETWVLADGGTATSAAYGAGCGGGTVPALQALGDPFLGHAGFGLDLLRARGNAGAVLLVSAGPARIALGGGCDLLVDPARLAQTTPLATNAAGFANLTFPVPYAPILVGATLFAQAFVADPTGPVLGLSATGGLQLVVGR